MTSPRGRAYRCGRGAARPSAEPEERERIGDHEMGHALVASTLTQTDPVHKISIIARGVGALGYTLQRLADDRFDRRTLPTRSVPALRHRRAVDRRDRGQPDQRQALHQEGRGVLATRWRIPVRRANDPPRKTLKYQLLMMVVLPVSREPVSGRNSLKTGKFQGISRVSAAAGDYAAGISQRIQDVARKFHTRDNREFSGALQGTGGLEQGPGFENCEVRRSAVAALEVEQGDGVSVHLGQMLAGELGTRGRDCPVSRVGIEHFGDDVIGRSLG